MPPVYVLLPAKINVPEETSTAIVFVPPPTESCIDPANAAPVPAMTNVDGVVVLLLPMMLAVPVPLVVRDPNVTLMPRRSRVPLVTPDPRTIADAEGNAPVEVIRSVPFCTAVVPV